MLVIPFEERDQDVPALLSAILQQLINCFLGFQIKSRQAFPDTFEGKNKNYLMKPGAVFLHFMLEVNEEHAAN